MTSPSLIDVRNALLVIVDVQEAFRSPIDDFERITRNIAVAAKGCRALDVPIVVTEQYPKGLGPTAEEIRNALPEDASVCEKSTFSACGSPSFEETLETLGRTEVILCGVETHICVFQTAHDLVSKGLQVNLLTDCVASRFEADRHSALKRMETLGVIHTTVEMALFELMRDSKHPKFKEIQGLIK